MRNVTIVESNVEPNKEHLWFYNGELKWFGPNGWETVTTSNTTTTSTPAPTITTTSTPAPITTSALGLRIYNNTNNTISGSADAGLGAVSYSIPASESNYVYGIMTSSIGGNIVLKIDAESADSILSVEVTGNIGSTFINETYSISNGGNISMPYTTNDALYGDGISLVVSVLPSTDSTTATTAPNVE